MVTPSSHTSGVPHLRSISTARDWGPSVGRTASASAAVPANSAVRAASWKASSV